MTFSAKDFYQQYKQDLFGVVVVVLLLVLVFTRGGSEGFYGTGIGKEFSSQGQDLSTNPANGAFNSATTLRTAGVRTDTGATNRLSIGGGSSFLGGPEGPGFYGATETDALRTSRAGGMGKSQGMGAKVSGFMDDGRDFEDRLAQIART